MKNNKIGLLGIACTGYFVVMQAANLNTLSVKANIEPSEVAKVNPVSLKNETPLKTVVANAITVPQKLAASPRTQDEEGFDLVVKMECWALSEVKIYAEPNEAGAVVGKISYRDSIMYTEFSEDWICVDTGYIRAQDVSFSEPLYRSVFVPKQSRDFKSYTDYRLETAWLQKDLQDIAETGTFGCRMVDGRYCVAVGTACNVIVGDYIDVVLENGTVIPAIVADIKQDIHTQDNNLVTKVNGCSCEFIVDMDAMDSNVKRSGSVSNACNEWKSSVVEIRVLGSGVFR